MRAKYLLLVASLLVNLAARGADAIPTAKLDAYFDALARERLANGAIAISERGTIRYERAVGFSSIENGQEDPGDTGTRYKIGSVTKLFTAVLTLQLVEGATITLDNKVAEFYPDLPNALDIRYRDLLQHRSGLANYSEAPGFETWRSRPHTHEEMLKIIRDGGVRFAPRERVEYNNSNYLLLSYMLERVHEKPYAAIVHERIVDKLGLPRTYYGEGTKTADHESVSYEFTPKGWMQMKETDPELHLGAGGLVSNPGDLVRFMDAVFARRLITTYSLDTLRGLNDGPPAALYPYSIAGHTGYGHGGRIEGYRACVYHFPDRGLSISYATNASVLAMDEIVDEVLALIFDRKRKPPTFTPINVTAAQRANLTGTWRSAPGVPEGTPFRQFAPTDQPLELTIAGSADTLTANLNGGTFRLVPLGPDEFMVEGLRYFLRAYPRSDELVVRGPEWSYYFRRAR